MYPAVGTWRNHATPTRATSLLPTHENHNTAYVYAGEGRNRRRQALTGRNPTCSNGGIRRRAPLNTPFEVVQRAHESPTHGTPRGQHVLERQRLVVGGPSVAQLPACPHGRSLRRLGLPSSWFGGAWSTPIPSPIYSRGPSPRLGCSWEFSLKNFPTGVDRRPRGVMICSPRRVPKTADARIDPSSGRRGGDGPARPGVDLHGECGGPFDRLHPWRWPSVSLHLKFAENRG